eukprot:m.248471 g.248471  ORF g.248471 m.248471 type:complete len:169 (-) comp16133_c0_seq27:1734-2240(-)
MGKKKAKKGGSKKAGKKGGKKKGSGKKKSSKGSGKKDKQVTEHEEPEPPKPPAYVYLAVRSATFHSMESFSCNFDEVFRTDTMLSDIQRLIAQRYDHTISDVSIFRGEVRGNELVRDDEELELESSLSDIGLEGVPKKEVETHETPTSTLYYDYMPPYLDCALINFIS